MSKLMHPIELERKRRNCKTVIEEIQRLEFETVSHCNICKSTKVVVISDIDRYGIPVRSGMCMNCGLIYLIDRLTRKGYETFYESGIYRKLISSFRGRSLSIGQIFNEQKKYTKTLIDTLRGFIPQDSRRKLLLDIGGSTGLVSKEFERVYGYTPLLLEPSKTEAEAARNLGIPVEHGYIEDWYTNKKFDLILLCRTIEHIFNLRSALNNIREMLIPEGFVFCDIADFVYLSTQYGPPEAVTQIDHCYWLSHRYAEKIFELSGFKVEKVFLNLPDYQIGYLLKLSETSPILSLDTHMICEDIERIMQLKNNWYFQRGEYYDLKSWLKIRMYKIRKKLVNF